MMFVVGVRWVLALVVWEWRNTTLSNTTAFFMISTSVVWTNRHVAATSSRYGAYYIILYREGHLFRDFFF
jgi:hypothetical protein